MHAAFEAFPAKDYCVVTLPHNSEEPALMANMTRLPPLAGATFPEVSNSAGLMPTAPSTSTQASHTLTGICIGVS